MLEKTRWHLRKAFLRVYRYFKHPRRLKSNRLMGWFACHFLDKRVWSLSRATFAGGAAIGVFVSLQLIPGQMLLGAIIAALVRVNIPTVAILSWINNPFTFAPIGLAEKHFGDWLLSCLGGTISRSLEDSIQTLLSFFKWLSGALPEWLALSVPEQGVRWLASMFTGGLAGGLLCVPFAYALAWFSWSGVARMLSIPSQHAPRTETEPLLK